MFLSHVSKKDSSKDNQLNSTERLNNHCVASPNSLTTPLSQFCLYSSPSIPNNPNLNDPKYCKYNSNSLPKYPSSASNEEKLSLKDRHSNQFYPNPFPTDSHISYLQHLLPPSSGSNHLIANGHTPPIYLSSKEAPTKVCNHISNDPSHRLIPHFVHPLVANQYLSPLHRRVTTENHSPTPILTSQNNPHQRANPSSNHKSPVIESGESAIMDAAFVWKLSKLGRIGSSRLRMDDDFSDRLNYQFSGVILFIFIGLIGIRQYVGKPIQCWIPQEFTRGWEEYAENYCWVTDTYFVSVEHQFPPALDREERTIRYYQWAPIVMAAQALLFYLPRLLWCLCMGYSGYNVRRILQVASECNVILPDVMAKNVRFLARYMEQCIYRQREHRKGFSMRVKHSLAKCTFLFCGKRYGNYLVVLYFTIKLLYLVNLLGQIYFMETFVGTNSSFYGIKVLIDLARGKQWDASGNFPRVTFCDFQSKKLGANELHTLQCVLPLNMFLEKIYIFLWFWHILVTCITFLSCIQWIIRVGLNRKRLKFIRKYLKIMSMMKETDKATSRKFVEDYLRPDGVFLLALISINCGDILAGDLVCELWNIYRHKGLHELEEVRYPPSSGITVPDNAGGAGGGGGGVVVGGGTAPPISRDYSSYNTTRKSGSNTNTYNNNNNNNNDDNIV